VTANHIAEQALNLAEVWAAAAFFMAIAMGLLYLALGLYGMALDKIIRHIGVWGAIFDFMQLKANRGRWWNRMVEAWDRIMKRRFD
jgi:hypothetical protein